MSAKGAVYWSSSTIAFHSSGEFDAVSGQAFIKPDLLIEIVYKSLSAPKTK